MSKKRSIIGRGARSIPKPIGGRSYVSPWGGDHEYKSHHEGQGDRHHLHGHGNHFGRVALSGPEQETPAQGPKIEDITDLV